MAFTDSPLPRHAILADQGRPHAHRFLSALDRPADAFASIGPNWFASVMGTGIVANAAALLPVSIHGLQTAALVVSPHVVSRPFSNTFAAAVCLT